jgi:hypothetical protein
VLKRNLFLVFIFFVCTSAFAQKKGRGAEYYSFGVNTMGSYFFGDVSSGIKTVRWGLGIQYLNKLSSHIAFTADANYIRLVADDDLVSSRKDFGRSNSYIRNLHMRNDVIELGIHGRYEFLPTNDYFTKRKKLNGFVTLGLGLLYSNPQAKDSAGYWHNLRPMHTENKSYSSFTAYIPVSLGVQYKISNHLDIEFELGYRFTFTDYLDDAKGTYVDPSTLQSNDAKYFSNRSAEATDSYTGKSRDLNYIQNNLGYPILTTPDGHSYVSTTSPGQLRGTRFGLDGYFVGMVRIVYIIPRKH